MILKEQFKTIRLKYRDLFSFLNERTRRCWAAAEAKTIGYGGVSCVARATGLTRGTIHVGLRELSDGISFSSERIRKTGGGRKTLTEKDPTLLSALNDLVEPVTRGDPESCLRWTCKSTPTLAAELTRKGHRVSQRTVYTLLGKQGYSLQSNKKTREGTNHLDRDAQFQYLNESTKQFHNKNLPVISVDTKKKELIGNFRNQGKEWLPKGNPREVNIHDFADPKLGKVIPYGVYDLSRNEGWVNVGIHHDTAAFAVESIRRWWIRMGRRRYPGVQALLITADGGGSNGSRTRLWKAELQKFADEIRITIHVRHFPPGTSKWNKIEHKMFCFISQNWRGRPLLSRATVVNLIAHTKTKYGLKIQAVLDKNTYDTGRKVSDEEMNALHLKQESFHGEWNYRLEPRTKKL